MSLLDFRMGITIASFHEEGEVEALKMRFRRKARYEIAFEWRLQRKLVGILSWPGAEFLEHWEILSSTLRFRYNREVIVIKGGEKFD